MAANIKYLMLSFLKVAVRNNQQPSSSSTSASALSGVGTVRWQKLAALSVQVEGKNQNSHSLVCCSAP